MGVSARPGEDLFFGNTATQVMAEAKRSVLFLASRSPEARPQPGEEIRPPEKDAPAA